MVSMVAPNKGISTPYLCMYSLAMPYDSDDIPLASKRSLISSLADSLVHALHIPCGPRGGRTPPGGLRARPGGGGAFSVTDMRSVEDLYCGSEALHSSFAENHRWYAKVVALHVA